MTINIKKVNRFLGSKNISSRTIIAILLTLSIALLNVIDSKGVSANNSDRNSNKVYKLSAHLPNPLSVIKLNKVEIKIVESHAEKVSREEREKQNLVLNDSREVVPRADEIRGEAPSFEEKRAIVKNIASSYNIDWKLLEAVWEVESGKSWDRNVRSYAGAQGPMQFLPSTFRHYAESGDNINSAQDSLKAGAKLLANAGASSGNIDKALFAYNHSTAYVAKVKRIASSINE